MVRGHSSVCNHQLLCHIDPRHVSALANQFTEGVGVSAGAAAEVQDPAALELRWKGEAAAEESGERYCLRQQQQGFPYHFEV